MPQSLVVLLIALPALLAIGGALSFVPDWQTWRLSRLGLAVGLGVPADLEDTLRARFRLRGVASAIGGLLGFLVGLAALAFVVRESGDPTFQDARFHSSVIGLYAVAAASSIGVAGGSAWASIRSVTVRGDGPRVARLKVLRVSDFLPPLVRYGTWALAGLAIATVVIVWIGEMPAARRLQAPSFVLVALGVVGVVVFEVLAHRVLARGRPAAGTDELVWDDALRSEALRALLIAPLQALALGTLYSFAIPPLSGISAFALFPALIGVAGVFVVSGCYRLTRTWYLQSLWPGARRRTPEEEARRITAATAERPAHAR